MAPPLDCNSLSPTTTSTQPLPATTMLPRLDGTSESKAITQRARISKRIANLCSTKKSDSSSEEFDGDEEIDNTSPMRRLSPRATGYDPSTQQRKERTISFRKRQSKISRPTPIVGSSSGAGGAQKESGGEGVLAGVSVPTIDSPITKSPSQSSSRAQMQSIRETTTTRIPMSVMSASPTREAALTSHPAGTKESESSEGGFETPMEEGSREDGYLNRK
ncbi:uncharacterized protein K460DRAFT_178982 [Cucurbitaria berberidis CBS 394.84]|uniref:Uncharacterized protein n=1 Tax=Cucurbitaria berberidis CBS 394.84 TaxID=1168544 RepID=A0A9P4GAC4_9PLEO|nr:uncharacterized protein K460DRAFT_178982 [Cucurbitaria berberidis CBS 394.84]KAF1842113.1 hypothetical protein K460DRAFT_178982 [Cucurbitaria berberidis CBS 394.84]